MKTSIVKRVLASAVVLIAADGCADTRTSSRPLQITAVTTPSAPAASKADLYYASAVKAIDRRDYALALDMLQAAREQNPRDPRVLNAFGVVYDKLGRFDLSARYYAQAEAADPGSKVVAANQAYSAVLQGWTDGGPAAPTPGAQALADAPPQASAQIVRVLISPAPAAQPTPMVALAGQATAPSAGLQARSPSIRYEPTPTPEPVVLTVVAPKVAAPDAVVLAAQVKPGPARLQSQAPAVQYEPTRPSELVTLVAAVKPVAPLAVASVSRPPSARPLQSRAPAVHYEPVRPATPVVLAVAARVEKPPGAEAAPKHALVTAWAPPAAKAAMVMPAVQTVARPAAVARANVASAAPAKPRTQVAAAPAPVKALASRAAPRLMHQPVILVDATGSRKGARLLRARLTRLGWTVQDVKTVRQPALAVSRIDYSARYPIIARALAKSLPGGVRMRSCVKGCSGVRLILGRDSLNWLATPRPRARLQLAGL